MSKQYFRQKNTPQQRVMLVQEEPRGPSQLVEIVIDSLAKSKFVFPDQQQLRSQQGQIVVIKAIRLITDKVLTNAMTVGGTIAPFTELQKASLTLYCEGWEKGLNMPLLSFNDQYDTDSANATTIPFRHAKVQFDDWEDVDWSKSFIQYANGLFPAGVPYVICLEVFYVKLDAHGKEIIGPS